MKLTEKRVTAGLRKAGYKLTPQRRAVVRAIVSSQDHLTPASIHRKANLVRPGVGLVTVYRTLEVLAGLGLVCELHAGGSCRSYTIGTPQHHHHLICSGCGTVLDFAGHYLGGLEADLSRDSGFRIDGHLLEFVGVCRDCQKAGEDVIRI